MRIGVRAFERGFGRRRGCILWGDGVNEMGMMRREMKMETRTVNVVLDNVGKLREE